MPELRRCLNCDHSVSSDASRCPACKTDFPFGLICKICGEPAPERLGILSSKNGGELFHRTCCDSVVPNFNTLCQTCKADIREPGRDRLDLLIDFRYRDLPCPSCGEPHPIGASLGDCKKCGFPVRESDLGVRQDEYASGRVHSQYFHVKCAPPRRRPAAPAVPVAPVPRDGFAEVVSAVIAWFRS